MVEVDHVEFDAALAGCADFGHAATAFDQTQRGFEGDTAHCVVHHVDAAAGQGLDALGGVLVERHVLADHAAAARFGNLHHRPAHAAASADHGNGLAGLQLCVIHRAEPCHHEVH